MLGRKRAVIPMTEQYDDRLNECWNLLNATGDTRRESARSRRVRNHRTAPLPLIVANARFGSRASPASRTRPTRRYPGRECHVCECCGSAAAKSQWARFAAPRVTSHGYPCAPDQHPLALDLHCRRPAHPAGWLRCLAHLRPVLHLERTAAPGGHSRHPGLAHRRLADVSRQPRPHRIDHGPRHHRATADRLDLLDKRIRRPFPGRGWWHRLFGQRRRVSLRARRRHRHRAVALPGRRAHGIDAHASPAAPSTSPATTARSMPSTRTTGELRWTSDRSITQYYSAIVLRYHRGGRNR